MEELEEVAKDLKRLDNNLTRTAMDTLDTTVEAVRQRAVYLLEQVKEIHDALKV